MHCAGTVPGTHMTSITLPSVLALRSISSAAGHPVLFADFIATMARSDFSRPCIVGYGSSPSRRGPLRHKAIRPDARPPRFRCNPFVRDVAFDPGGASAPRIAAPHMLPSTTVTVSASAIFGISWLNPTPHTIAVYASRPPSPENTQRSLTGGRYPLPVPDSHRLDRTSLSWRTTVTGTGGRYSPVRPVVALGETKPNPRTR
jgi:hypothetical protein